MTVNWWQRELRDSYGWIIIGVLVSVFLSLYFSWQLGFFCLLFMATAWWVWDNTEQGFWLLIVIAPILPMLKITQTIGTVTLIKDVIILTLFGRLFLWPLVKKSLPYRRATLMAPIVFLSVWTMVAMLRADNTIMGVLRTRDIILYMLLYLAVLYLPHTARRMKRRLFWFMSSVTVLLTLAIYQWWWAMDSAVLRFDPVRQIWIPRISSILAHPSIFGQYVIAAALLACALALYASTKRKQIVWWIAWLTMLPFIWLTYSRAVWIGMVLGTGLMVVTYILSAWGQKHSLARLLKVGLVAGTICVLAGIGMMKFTPAGQYIQSFIDPRYASNQERLEFVARLIAPMSNWEALFGRGLGEVVVQNFRESDLEFYDLTTGNSRDVQLTKNKTLVDNQYLKTGVEMGLVGLLVYMWIYWRFFLAGIRNISQEKQLTKVLGLWGVGFVAAFSAQALFIDVWDIWPTNGLFWVVAGLIGGSWKMFLTKSVPRDKNNRRELRRSSLEN